MSTQNPSEMDALRQEIQAAIAAGRELGADMDQHLADSAIERYQRERAAREKTLQKQPDPASPPAPHQYSSAEWMARTTVTLAAIAAFIVIMIWARDFWWVIFFMPAIAGWWGRDHWSGRNALRDERADTRRQLRETHRRLRIQRMRDEIRRLESGSPDEYD